MSVIAGLFLSSIQFLLTLSSSLWIFSLFLSLDFFLLFSSFSSSHPTLLLSLDRWVLPLLLSLPLTLSSSLWIFSLYIYIYSLYNHEVAAFYLTWTTVLCWPLAQSFENEDSPLNDVVPEVWLKKRRRLCSSFAVSHGLVHLIVKVGGVCETDTHEFDNLTNN